MTFTYRSLLLLLMACYMLPCQANGITDTTRKKLPITSSNILTDQLGEYIAYLKEGVTNLKQDSLAKGIHLIHVAMDRAATLNPIKRVLDYRGLEVFDLLAIIDTGKLSVPERQLGQALMKDAFAYNKQEGQKHADDLIKNAPNTAFTKRIRLIGLLSADRLKADVLLNDLLKENPSLISAQILKAELLYESENYKDAISYCNNLIAQWPQYAHAYHVRAKSYSYINEGEKAIRDYNMAISLFPKNILYQYDRADELLDMEKYKDAITGFLKVVAIYPNYRWSNYNLARSYKGALNYDSAHYYADKHIKLEAEDGDGYNLKGDIYYAQQNYAKATQLHTQAINIDNTRASYYEDRGDDYYYAENLDNAIADFEKSLKLDKNSAYNNDRLGDCYYKKGEYEKSIPYHEKAVKIDRGYKYAYLGLYFNYSKLGKLKQAIEACHKAIAIDSTYSSALGNLGWAYYQNGSYDECIQYSYKAIRHNQGAAYAMFNIALATLRKGEYEKAKDLYTHFITLCKQKDYTISDGAVDDLKDLIKQHIAENEATFIIKNIFKATI